MVQRENLASRLGFLLLSAGCAIGLGNVWRFPFITGKYGGAVFLAAYFVFLLAMGLPVLIMEFSVGRASRKNMGDAFSALAPQKPLWHGFGWFSLIGSYALMMFYMPVCGWMLAYFWLSLNGGLSLPSDQIPGIFTGMLGNPQFQIIFTLLTALIGFGVCAMGLRRGVEKVVKVMMTGLILIMIGLAINSLTLPGASKGVAFYLIPDLQRALDAGIGTVISEAMNQAFFTLSLGVGAMCIFGSYLDRKNSLVKESAVIVGLDTFVALTAGMIIFPACAAFNVSPGSGPGLIFITLPNIFNAMPGGRFWGALFFVFMSAAALTTVIAVVENTVSFFMDKFGWTRRKAVLINAVTLTLATLPCIFGFNIWSGFMPFGEGSSVLDLEDFIISNNLLPLGSLVFCLFCCSRYGWGWKNFREEANAGSGMKLADGLRFYLTWVLPIVLVVIFVQGYIQKFF